MLSSRKVGCTFCYALLRNDRHTNDQKWACLHKICMIARSKRLKSPFPMQTPLICEVFTTKMSLTFEYQGGCGT